MVGRLVVCLREVCLLAECLQAECLLVECRVVAVDLWVEWDCLWVVIKVWVAKGEVAGKELVGWPSVLEQVCAPPEQ